MNRRQLGQTLLMGAVAAGAMPAMALAQGGAMGEAERDHVTNTLRVGGLALQSSQVALRKGSMTPVKDFATFEVEEQTTIAQIIREMTGMAPPPPDAKAQAVMTKLNAASGAAFDRDYIAAQLDGHRELLAIQERYLAAGRDPHHRHVTMLARGQIKEHIKLLTNLQTTKHL
jgi:putative membrane protein